MEGGACAITLGGERLLLLAQRAVWWPSGRVLFVADVHLGKAATLRAHGIPVPAGTSRADLARLDALVRHWQPRRLVVLGDFLHHRAGRTPALMRAIADAVATWALMDPPVTVTVVRGNHDRHAGDPPADSGIDCTDAPWSLGATLQACHEPPDDEAAPGIGRLAGHVHPGVRLHAPGGDAARLPCFVQTQDTLILPAFGEWTGLYTVAPTARQRCHAIGAGRVWSVPPGRRGRLGA